MYDLVPLSLLAVGQIALIAELTGSNDQLHRLKEMGLRDGAEVEMIRSGSPCIVRVDDQRFCFRHDSLADVMVRIGATP